jgi:hypothetical protein
MCTMLLESIGNEPFQAYLSNMEKDGTWGDGTILLAASIYYKRQIILYSDDSKKRIIMSDRYSDSHAFRHGFVDGNHYVSLLPDLPASSLPFAANLQLPEPEIPNKSLDVENDVENSKQCFPTTTKSKNSGKSEPGLGACGKKIIMKRKLQFPWLMAAGD